MYVAVFIPVIQFLLLGDIFSLEIAMISIKQENVDDDSVIKSLDNQKIYPRQWVYIKLHHSDHNVKNICFFGMSNYEMKYMALLVTQGIPWQIEKYKSIIMIGLSYNYNLS